MQRETKIALITGSSRGIGRAVAMKLAEAGIFVYINYRQQEAAAEQTLAAIKRDGGAGSLCPFDVADRVAVQGAVAKILQDKGRLDILVNNAGVVKSGLIARTKEADWDSLSDTKRKGNKSGHRSRWGGQVNRKKWREQLLFWCVARGGLYNRSGHTYQWRTLHVRGRMELEEKVIELIIEQLNVTREQCVPGASFLNDLGADSLDLMELIMEMEEQFGVAISDEDLQNIRTIQNVIDFLRTNGAS